MEWYPLNTERMLSPEWLRIPPAVRAHFISIEMYCAWRSNGGVIKNAQSWSKRDWDRAVAIPKTQIKVLEAHGLLSWEGPDLIVTGYDSEAEERARRGKQQRVNAALSRWSSNADRNASADASADAIQKTRSATRTPKERKKEKKERSVAKSATSLPPDKPKKKLPYTIAEVAKVLSEESGGLFNPDMPDTRLAKPVTDVIRQLDGNGVTLADISAAGRWIAKGGTGGHEVGMLWLAGVGKLGNAVAQARKMTSPSKDVYYAPDGEPIREAAS